MANSMLLYTCCRASTRNMSKTIQQTVTLSAPSDRLYSMYLDPRAHGGFTGNQVTIAENPGSPFSAFGGMLSGQILQLIPGRLIVQSWRSMKFHEDDIDSTLVLAFSPAGEGLGKIEMVHVNVPDHDAKDVEEGWPQHYWEPWRKFLERES